MEIELTRFQRLKLAIYGVVYLNDRIKEGWTTPFPFYAFKCPRHGIVESRPYGFKKYLRCPKCSEEEEKHDPHELVEKVVQEVLGETR